MNETDRSQSLGLVIGTTVLLLLCTCLLPSVALSWNGSCHRNMAYDAKNTLPTPIKSQFSNTVNWINEPDRNRVVSHVNIGGCAWQIKKLALKAVEILREDGKTETAFATIGKGTHYVQDLNCPHHGIGRYDQGLHESFEKKVFGGFWLDSDFDGFHYIADYKIFAYNAARFSKRYIKYCNRLKYDPGYLEKYEKLLDPLWDHTVNDCLDYWLTILWDGLGETQYRELGLPLKVGTRAEKKLKFPKVKDLWD